MPFSRLKTQVFKQRLSVIDEKKGKLRRACLSLLTGEERRLRFQLLIIGAT